MRSQRDGEPRTAELLDLDGVAACSHLTTPIVALPVDPDSKYRAVMTGPAVSTHVEVNFDWTATTNHVASARRRMIGMVRWHRAARRR